MATMQDFLIFLGTSGFDMTYQVGTPCERCDTPVDIITDPIDEFSYLICPNCDSTYCIDQPIEENHE
jgi:hypothetical protein